MKQGIKETGMPLKPGDRNSAAAENSAAEHSLNWLDAADGNLSKREADRDSAQQFPVNIDRAAAHTLQNAGLSQRTAAQSSEDEGLLWPEILEDTEDFDLELFNSISLEDGLPDTVKSRSDILNWEELLTPSQRD